MGYEQYEYDLLIGNGDYYTQTPLASYLKEKRILMRSNRKSNNPKNVFFFKSF